MPRRIFAALLGGLVLGLAAPAPAPPLTHRVSIRGIPFELEVAADPITRQLGLAGRRELASRGGMLFVFPNEIPRRFWMRDCVMEMGLLFLDRHGRIVALHEMQIEPPRLARETEQAYLGRLPRYPSFAPAQFAVELRAGVIDALRLVRGQRIDLAGAPTAIR